MADASSQAHRLFRVRRTCFQMLGDRGYYVADAERHMTYEEFRARFGDGDLRKDELTVLAAKRTDENDQIFVFFVDSEGKDKISNKVIAT
jgi:DNA-directed RNA polymerases I, II, and III subunit RPABC1